jgi:long-chain fatty acid transport protein
MKPVLPLRLVAAAIFVFAVLAPALVHAGADGLFEEYGVSPRDTAMGNAGAGLANDYTAAYYDPAGLGFLHGSHLSLGYRGVYPYTFIHFNPSNGHNLGQSPSTDLFLLGLSSDLKFRRIVSPRITDRLGFGMALAFSQYMKSFTLFADPNTPYLFRYTDRPVSLMSVYMGLAVRIFSWFSFGGSMCLAPSETYADVIAHTNIYVPSFRNETHQGMATRAWTKVVPVLGAMFRAPAMGRDDYLQLGLVWRDEVYTIDGSGEVTSVTRIVFEKTGETITVPNTTFALHQLSGYSPMQFTAALGWNVTPRVHLAVDGIWKRWSMWLDGDENQPNPPFKDTFQVRLGYEQETQINWAWIHDLIVRAGYYYEPSPVPDMNGRMNILDPDKHVGSVGAGFRFADPLDIILTPIQFDLAYQLHWLVEERLSNNHDPVYPPLTAGGQVHNFAATMNFEF